MQAESQHLDFLISQYVDGSLEGAAKKSVEQKMLTDPQARKLYADHREVQDVLDDYGSRIPLVNWAEFDKKLDARLEIEAREKQRVSRFRRRLKPVAAAAALLLSVSLGYAWHAFAHAQNTAQVFSDPPAAAVTQTAVSFPENSDAQRASQYGLAVAEPSLSPHTGAAVTDAVVVAPAEQVALQALQANLTYGFGGNPSGVFAPQLTPARGSAVGVGSVRAPQGFKDDPDNLIAH